MVSEGVRFISDYCIITPILLYELLYDKCKSTLFHLSVEFVVLICLSAYLLCFGAGKGAVSICPPFSPPFHCSSTVRSMLVEYFCSFGLKCSVLLYAVVVPVYALAWFISTALYCTVVVRISHGASGGAVIYWGKRRGAPSKLKPCSQAPAVQQQER